MLIYKAASFFHSSASLSSSSHALPSLNRLTTLVNLDYQVSSMSLSAGLCSPQVGLRLCVRFDPITSCSIELPSMYDDSESQLSSSTV